MFSELKLSAIAISAVLLIASGAAPAWYIQGLRWHSNVASIQQANTAAMKTISDAAQSAAVKALTQQQAYEANISAMDAKYQQDLANEKTVNDALRTAVDNGSRVLRVKANCPAATGSSNGVPKNTNAASVNNSADPELAADARQDYYTLIDQLNQMNSQLLECQSFAISVSSTASQTTEAQKK